MLLEAAMQNHEWTTAIVDGWMRATTTHRNVAWSRLLWKWAFEMSAPNVRRDQPYFVQMSHLRSVMSPGDAEQLILHHFESVRIDDYRWVSTMEWFPGPWSIEFGQFYLDALRDQYPETTIQSD